MLFRIGTWSERLFGHGYHAVGSLLLPGVMDGRSILAHNDFVEYIYDYGIIGTVCYILFVLMIIKKICEQFRSRNSFLPSDCTAFVIFISISLFSYGVVQSTTINMLAIYIGIMLARDARGEFSKELRIK